jgi:hypothetical protein
MISNVPLAANTVNTLLLYRKRLSMFLRFCE